MSRPATCFVLPVTDFELDLRSRWTPSRAQDEAAARELRLTGVDVIYSGHVLIGKQFGWWGDDITVFHLHGVLFTDRDEVSAAIARMTDVQHRLTGLPCTGGWTTHRLGTEQPSVSADGSTWLTRWAVFEDILAVSPRETRET